MVKSLQDETPIEVATIGNEGLVGLPAYLGTDTSPTWSFVQIPGEALRTPAGALREETAKAGRSMRACNTTHRRCSCQSARRWSATGCALIDDRCAHWRLMTRNRVACDEFYLTQKFLA
jgi:hypothetical protein